MLLAYCVGLIATLAEWRAYAASCDRRLIRWSLLGALLWAVMYCCLGAFSAASLMLLTGLRSWLASRLKGYRVRTALFFVLLFCCLSGLTWQGWVSLLPTFAAINTTLALFFAAGIALRWLLVPSSLAWILNDLVWQAWPALLAESVALLINCRTIQQLKRA